MFNSGDGPLTFYGGICHILNFSFYVSYILFFLILCFFYFLTLVFSVSETVAVLEVAICISFKKV